MAGIFQNGIWSCGFDFMPSAPPTSIIDQQLNANANSTAARFNGKGVQLVSGNPSNYVGRSLNTNLTQCIIGFAHQAVNLPGGGIMGIAEFYDTSNSTAQFCLGVNSSGQLGLYHGAFQSIGALIGSLSTAVVSSAAWYYYEINHIVGTSGSVTVNLNGGQILSYSGNTNFSGGGYIGRILIGGAVNSGAAPQTYVDDWYILDGTGGAPFNAFLGPGRIQTDGPSGDFSNSGWSITTPLGTAHQNFAQIPPSSANYNYVSNIATNTTLLCSFPALSAPGVYFFNVWDSDELDAAGTGDFQIRFSNNGHTQDGTAISPTAASYLYHNTISTVDPNTNSLWYNGSVSASNTLQIGPHTPFF